MQKLLFLFLVPTFCAAQESAVGAGIQFYQGKSWDDVKRKAKLENKYIFMDVNASWCVPCKKMNEEVFILQHVGNLINPHFISIKVQIDTSRNDNEFVATWYKESKQIKEIYKPGAVPTFLFFSPKGEIVHRDAGYKNRDEFIELAMNALNPDRQYYTLLKAYEQNKNDTSFLKRMLIAASKADDTHMWLSAGKELINHIPDDSLLTRENIMLIKTYTTNSSDKGYRVISKNASKIDKIMNSEGFAAHFIDNIVWKEIFVPEFQKRKDTEPRWRIIHKKAKRAFDVHIADKLIINAKKNWYRFKQDWPMYVEHLVASMEKYESKSLNVFLLNNSAWDIFLRSDNKNQLNKAISWVERAIKVDSNYLPALDTYANLLYKTGNIQQAIDIEQKVLRMDPNNQEYKLTFDKMKRRVPTW